MGHLADGVILWILLVVFLIIIRDKPEKKRRKTEHICATPVFVNYGMSYFFLEIWFNLFVGSRRFRILIRHLLFWKSLYFLDSVKYLKKNSDILNAICIANRIFNLFFIVCGQNIIGFSNFLWYSIQEWSAYTVLLKL